MPRQLTLPDYRPHSKLVVPETKIAKPACPVIDAHNHLGMFGGYWERKSLRQLLDQMDRAHVKAYVDLDGGWGEEVLDKRLKKFQSECLLFFGGPNWKHWKAQGNGFGEFAAKRLREQKARGAEGLKIWKDFGLHVKDHKGKLVAIDDKRLIPLWETSGELGLPVVIHIADPVAFFDPINARNERWEELHAHMDWHFPAPKFPSFNKLIEAFARLVERHPKTIFIGAHIGCYSENLGWVSRLLDRCPNFNVDISARISELGRQPYSSRRFFEKYQDRILFGIDAGPHLETYQIYWRFLETKDEYFNYGAGEVPGQGRWQIYGLGLSPKILRKIYFDNANRLIFKGRVK